MRLTSLLLALLIALAPWSGALALSTPAQGQGPVQLAADDSAGMPCHSQADAQPPAANQPCPGCGATDCGNDSCQQCAGSLSALINPLVFGNAARHGAQHARAHQAFSSAEPVPDSPPPIA